MVYSLMLVFLSLGAWASPWSLSGISCVARAPCALTVTEKTACESLAATCANRLVGKVYEGSLKPHLLSCQTPREDCFISDSAALVEGCQSLVPEHWEKIKKLLNRTQQTVQNKMSQCATRTLGGQRPASPLQWKAAIGRKAFRQCLSQSLPSLPSLEEAGEYVGKSWSAVKRWGQNTQNKVFERVEKGCERLAPKNPGGSLKGSIHGVGGEASKESVVPFPMKSSANPRATLIRGSAEANHQTPSVDYQQCRFTEGLNALLDQMQKPYDELGLKETTDKIVDVYINRLSEHRRLENCFDAQGTGLEFCLVLAGVVGTTIETAMDLPTPIGRETKALKEAALALEKESAEKLIDRVKKYKLSIPNSDLRSEIKDEYSDLIKQHFPNLKPGVGIESLGKDFPISEESQKLSLKIKDVGRELKTLPVEPKTRADILKRNELLKNLSEAISDHYREYGFETKTTPVRSRQGVARNTAILPSLQEEIRGNEIKLKSVRDDLRDLKIALSEKPQDENLQKKIKLKILLADTLESALTHSRQRLQREMAQGDVDLIDSYRVSITGSKDSAQDKMLKDMREKTQVSDLFIDVSPSVMTGSSGAGFNPIKGFIKLDTLGAYAPENVLRGAPILHEIHHAYYTQSALNRKDLPFYGRAVFSKVEDSLVTLPGYEKLMAFDEIPAYRKTLAWAKSGRMPLESPGGPRDIPTLSVIKTAVEYREASRSALRLSHQVQQQFVDPDFASRIKYNITERQGVSSSAFIPILDAKGEEIGNFGVILPALATDNADSKFDLLREQIQRMENAAEAEFDNAQKEVEQLRRVEPAD